MVIITKREGILANQQKTAGDMNILLPIIFYLYN